MCTLQAPRNVSGSLGVTLDEAEERSLLDVYLHLPAFAEVRDGLSMLKRAGYRLVALTNGTSRSARSVLENAGISEYLEDVLSVEPIATFKPIQRSMHFWKSCLRDARRPRGSCPATPFDVIGAKAAGLSAAWLRRDPQRSFDPWEFSPDLVVGSLEELCQKLPPSR